MKAKDIRSLTEPELVERLDEEQKHLFELRFQAATDRLETPSAIRKSRREIARILTVKRERDLKLEKPVNK